MRRILRLVVFSGSLFSSFGILLHGQDCTSIYRKNRNGLVYVHADYTLKETGQVVSTSGTGFVVSKSGYFLTCYHVIGKYSKDKIDRVSITGTISSKEGPPKSVEFLDSKESQDVALLKFKDTSPDYQAVSIGDPGRIEVGNKLCSMGFPFNLEFHTSEGELGGKGGPNGSWSTQMPSNFGESGAPVFDSTGSVVAIKIGGLDPTQVQDINYLVPISMANGLLSEVPDLPSRGATSELRVLSTEFVNPETGRFLDDSNLKGMNSFIQKAATEQLKVGYGVRAAFNDPSYPEFQFTAQQAYAPDDDAIRDLGSTALDSFRAIANNFHYLFYPKVWQRDGAITRISGTFFAPERVLNKQPARVHQEPTIDCGAVGECTERLANDLGDSLAVHMQRPKREYIIVCSNLQRMPPDYPGMSPELKARVKDIDGYLSVVNLTQNVCEGIRSHFPGKVDCTKGGTSGSIDPSASNLTLSGNITVSDKGVSITLKMSEEGTMDWQSDPVLFPGRDVLSPDGVNNVFVPLVRAQVTNYAQR